MQKFPFYFLSTTKKNKKILKILKEEGFISHFYYSEKRIKVFLKQDLAKSFGHCSPVKTQKKNLKFIAGNETWKSNLKPGIFLFNTKIGFFSERILKRELNGGLLLTCIK